ncbi:MAG TPA: MFS transporter [Saprospiraceae bacterium]|nr:MFS transporter [Saprospiraceae bacterium]
MDENPMENESVLKEPIEKNNHKVINAWAFFDWANSAYALVISTAIFPIYFIQFTPDWVSIGGRNISNSALYSYAVSASYLIIAFISPLLSGIADYGGKRKFFLRMFTLVGSIACITLYFFKGEPQLWLGTSAFILATIGFAGGIVFYDAYLPLIVTEDRYDKVSAKGFSYGYIGSVILLIGILVMIQQPQWFGIQDAQLPARIGFVMVGLWWIGFAQISFKYLPKDSPVKMGLRMMSKGYNEVKGVFIQLKSQPWLQRFLLAFFFYSAGVQTILYLATVFAEKELSFVASELIILVLILQLVAIGGAYFFAWVSSKTSNKSSLSIMLIIWIFICAGAYFTTGKLFFYVLAAMVGMVMGGIQSLSRSSYSKMLKDKNKDTTSYFSFYDVLYKVAIVVGTFSFGFVDNLTGNMRYSVLVLAAFFIIGLLLLRSVKAVEIS